MLKGEENNKKVYRFRLALAGTALLTTVCGAGFAMAGDITSTAGGAGTFYNPFYYKIVESADQENLDSIIDGISSEPETGVLTGSRNYLAGIRSTNTGFFNNAAISLYIKNNASYADVTGIYGGAAMNSGDILISANGGTEPSAYAVATGIAGDVTGNSGDVLVTANGGAATSSYPEPFAYAYAYAAGIEGNTTGNSGDILVTAHGGTATSSYFSAYAYADAVGIDGDVTENSARILVTATGGTATSSSNSSAWTDAVGIEGDVIENSGDILVTADGGTATPSGSSAWAWTYAKGIAGDVTKNSGDILVSAHGGTAISSSNSSAWTYSKGIEGDVTENSGDILVTANGRTAISSDSSASASAWTYAKGIEGDVTENSGDILVSANGGTAISSGSSAWVWTYAKGIEGNVTENNGDILVSAHGGTATSSSNSLAWADASAIGIHNYISSTNLINTGTINVSAQAGVFSEDGGQTYKSDEAKAYGIWVDWNSAATLHSTGLIHAAALQAIDGNGMTLDLGQGKNLSAYQVYTNSDLSITGYSMKFNSQAQVDAEYTGTIKIADSSSAVVSFDNTTLYAFTDNGFNQKISYKIPTLVADAVVSDQFSAVQLAAASPDYTLKLIDGGGNDLQELSIIYTPKSSTPLLAAEVTQRIFGNIDVIVGNSMINPMLSLMQQGNPQTVSYEGVRFSSMDSLLDPSSMSIDVMPKDRGWAFVLPYYTDLNNNSSPVGYDADIYGLTGGYNFWLNPDLILGFHAGYGRGDIDFSGAGYDLKEESVDAGSFGVQSLYRLGKSWLVQGIASFVYTSNDYSDQNPLNRENGAYNTYGVDADVDLSHVFTFHNNHIIPSLGLRYLWQHEDGFTADNLDNADVAYGDLNEQQLYGHFGVDWYGHLSGKGQWQITPTLGLGIQQALTDNEFDHTMTVGSFTTNAASETDDTLLTAHAAIEFTRDSYALSAEYAGSYSDDTRVSSVYLQIKYLF